MKISELKFYTTPSFKNPETIVVKELSHNQIKFWAPIGGQKGLEVTLKQTGEDKELEGTYTILSSGEKEKIIFTIYEKASTQEKTCYMGFPEGLFRSAWYISLKEK